MGTRQVTGCSGAGVKVQQIYKRNDKIGVLVRKNCELPKVRRSLENSRAADTQIKALTLFPSDISRYNTRVLCDVW